MSVNHFLWTDEKLVDEFKNFIEATVDVEDVHDDVEVEFNATKHNEFWELRKEILSRMNR
jgi:hypothetical protein